MSDDPKTQASAELATALAAVSVESGPPFSEIVVSDDAAFSDLSANIVRAKHAVAAAYRLYGSQEEVEELSAVSNRHHFRGLATVAALRAQAQQARSPSR